MASTSIGIVFVPDEIIENMLLRLPGKFVTQFRCVSKTWNLLISELMENKKRIMLRVLNRNSSLIPWNVGYPLQTQTCNVKCVWGSCDGLLCVTLKVTGCVVLWNPSTREYKKLPVALHDYDQVRHGNYMRDCERYGLGYNPTSMDYEVVRIVRDSHNSSTVQIYSLRNNSWRRSWGLTYVLYHLKSGVTVDGKLHFLAAHCLKPYSCILAYDFSDEKFREVALPEFRVFALPEFRSITTLDGKLFLFLNYLSLYKGWVTKEGWVMKDYGSRGSWTKLFRIEAGDFGQITVEPLFNTRQGEIVMRFGNSIVLYDPKDNNLSNVKMVVDVKGRGLEANMYTESLVSLGIGSEIVGETDSWANMYTESLVSLGIGSEIVGETDSWAW